MLRQEHNKNDKDCSGDISWPLCQSKRAEQIELKSQRPGLTWVAQLSICEKLVDKTESWPKSDPVTDVSVHFFLLSAVMDKVVSGHAIYPALFVSFF